MDVSKTAELDRLVDEVEDLRVKLSLARDARTRDEATIERLERSIILIEKAIGKTKGVIGNCSRKIY